MSLELYQNTLIMEIVHFENINCKTYLLLDGNITNKCLIKYYTFFSIVTISSIIQLLVTKNRQY